MSTDDDELGQKITKILIDPSRWDKWPNSSVEKLVAIIEAEKQADRQTQAAKLKERILDASQEYEATDLVRMEHWNETPLIAVPVAAINKAFEEDV